MSTAESQPNALRLTFTYDDDSVRLSSRRVVEMTVPPSDSIEGYQGQAGFWAELRDPAGVTIYRRVLHDPIPVYHEVHSAHGPATHTLVQNRAGAFEIVVPVPPPGSRLVLFGTPQPPGIAIGSFAEERARAAVPRVGTGEAQELASFNLDAAPRP